MACGFLCRNIVSLAQGEEVIKNLEPTTVSLKWLVWQSFKTLRDYLNGSKIGQNLGTEVP